jgi:hypothetical protein
MKKPRQVSHEHKKVLIGIERLLLLIRILEAIDDDNQAVAPKIPRTRLVSVLRKHAGVDLDTIGEAIWEDSIAGELSVFALLVRPNRRALANVVIDVTRLFLQHIPPWPTLRPLVLSIASGRITADMFQTRRPRRPGTRAA